MVSIKVWNGRAKEGSSSAELVLYQTGKINDNLKVKFILTGTAKNGYDYQMIRNFMVMRGLQGSGMVVGRREFGCELFSSSQQASIIIRPVDDFELEGDESVTITLAPDSTYSIDPKNSSQTIIIQDNELPDVQFEMPCSIEEESSDGHVKVILTKASSVDVKVEYTISGRLAWNSSDDYNLLAGTLTIPSGKLEGIIPLNIINDTIAEDDETIVLEITKASNANIGLNEKHYYTIVNDDGEVSRSSIYDKIYGIILGSRGGSSLGAVVEGVGQMELIEEVYGDGFNEFIPYGVNSVYWSHPAGGTEDGIERQKCIATAIIEKQDRITAEDLMKVWVRDYEIEDMYFLCMPYDRTLTNYAKWGFSVKDLPKTLYGMPSDLGGGIHLTARVFHPIAAINAGDPEGAIKDTKEVGRIYYENKDDDAFAWGGVYNAALALAMLDGSTVESVIEGALKYATPEIKKEIEYGLAIADKYTDPMDRRFREDLNRMYADIESPYCASKRMTKYIGSSIYENVTCSFAIFKITKGDVELAVKIANNRGRDTDCTAASAGAMAGALTGTTTIPKSWIENLDQGLKDNPYSNSHMTDKATAQALYRALQNKLKRMSEELQVAEKQYKRRLPLEFVYLRNYLSVMKKNGVIF